MKKIFHKSRARTFTLRFVMLLVGVGVVLLWRAPAGSVLGRVRAKLASMSTSEMNVAGGTTDVSSASSTASTEGLATYDHETPFFAFAYPKELKVTELTEKNGNEAIFLGGGEKQGFQLHFFPFDEEGPLTVERIRKDMPEVVIEEPQTALITSTQISAVLFWSNDTVLGKTRELWFIHDGYFYQLTTFPEYDTTLAGIMERWTF